MLPQNSTLVDLLQHRAIYQPQHTGYVFLSNGKTEEIKLSYQSLEQQAKVIAARLQKMNLMGERALLLYYPGLDFITAFLGCLYAGVVAVPVYPPQGVQQLFRLDAIAADAQVKIVLTATTLLGDIQQYFSPTVKFAHLAYLATDALDRNLASCWEKPTLNSDTLAFLQYTSGSTGNPKGVMVSHGNLLQNSANILRGFNHNTNSRVVSWLPHYHDMGLIGGILQPLFGGFPVILMSPASFLRKPIRWLQAISGYQATTSGGPNFAYNLCLQKITAEQKATLDLSSWEVAFIGAEPISPKTLDQFAEAFAPCGFRREAFYPCYGLAEATLFVTGKAQKAEGNSPLPPENEEKRSNVWLPQTNKSEASFGFPLGKGDRRGISQGRQQGDHNGGWQKAEEKKFKDNSKNSYHLKEPIIYTLNSAALQENRVVVTTPNSAKTQPIVSCGQSSLNEKVIIVDPDTLLPCSPEKVGEIWVSGASITQGYWKQPQSTQDTFRAYLADTGEGPFLRTGDLGFLHNEELFVTGRLKDVIIIRGHNYYPQDIELTVASSHPALRPHSCVATNITFEEEEKLVIILEIKKKSVGKLDLKEFIATIRSNISQNHGIQTDTIVLVKQGSIPKTSSGKLQRQACKKAYVENHLQVIESWQAVDDLLPYIPLKPHLPSDFSPLIKGGGLSPAIVTNLIQWLREYANEQINSRLIDERRCIPPSIVLDFGNQGLLGMQVPSEYGGLGLNHTDTMRIIEQLGAIDTTLSLFVGLNNILGIRPLLHFGSQSLKEELLPRLATGRELAAFALTEPGAGSNPQAIAASAISQSPDNWVLNGTKIWSGSAAWAGIINVFVQEQDNQGKFQGMSGFVIRKGTPGLRQGPEALTMGMRGMVQNTVYFENVAVNSSQRLGNLGDGMKVAQDAMMYGRLAIAAASVGGMKRCAQLWHRYSSRRTISTGRLLDNPLVLARLNGLTTAITTVEILVTTITQLLDQEKEVPIEAYTVCKVAAPEFYWQAADSLVQFLGGRGYIETNIAPQILRDARVLRIFEGPTETLTAFLGSRVIYQRQELKQFLCQTLRVPDVYQQLKESVQKIQDYYNSSRSPFSDAAKTRQWTAMQCGEVAMWGILLAALQSKALSTKAESLERAITWTQEHFQQKIAQAFSKNPDALIVTNAKKTSEFIVDYETAIGDLEQTLAGEDRELDELLRKQADLEIGELGRLGDWETGETRGTIEDWLMNWLGNKLKISGQSIDPSRAFADYGIDSVMAVELAQDLQEWLAYPQELEASLAWNFPTIRALAKYLSSRLDRSISDEQADSSTSIESEMLSAIKDCSEDEVQAAITQEMTELESLLKGGYR